MNLRQKRIIVILAIINGIVIFGLVALLLRRSGAFPSPLPTPRAQAPRRTEISPLSMSPHQATAEATARATCQWQAAQHLAQAGLGGTVHLTPDALRFDLVQATEDPAPSDQAAQAIWTAFDIALALMGSGCDMFDHVDISIRVQEGNDSDVNVNVSAADLAAFGSGELSEEAFIQRVTYKVGDR